MPRPAWPGVGLDHCSLTRRRFVVFVAALSGAVASVSQQGLFRLASAWAESEGPVTAEVRTAMVRMARLLYPHDALPDDVYAAVLDHALSDIAAGPAFALQLEEAAAALAERSHGVWLGSAAAEQIEGLRGIDAEPYFIAIRNRVRAGIYNGVAFWQHVGYPGPSKDFGGYLHHGAGEVDWLPDDT